MKKPDDRHAPKLRRHTPNPGAGVAPLRHFDINLEDKERTLARVQRHMTRDGFSYLSDLIQVLLSHWTRGRMTKRLKREVAILAREAPGSGPERFSLTLSNAILEAAAERLPKSGFLSLNALIRFLLEAYAQGKVELCLRRRRHV